MKSESAMKSGLIGANPFTPIHIATDPALLRSAAPGIADANAGRTLSLEQAHQRWVRAAQRPQLLHGALVGSAIGIGATCGVLANLVRPLLLTLKIKSIEPVTNPDKKKESNSLTL